MEIDSKACDSMFDPAALRRRVEELRAAGVVIVDDRHTYVSDEASVGPGAVLFPGTYLIGACVVGADSRIGPDCWIEDSAIDERCTVRYSVLESARVRAGCAIGPYAHLRPGADVGPEARVGNFVEIKAARLGKGVRAGHLSYLGDAEIGENVNIGAGTITCNYDGEAKSRTVIDDGAFIGSHAALVAPVRIGREAFVAAGSTITEDVPAGKRAFGRARQVVTERKASEEEAG